MGRELTGVFEQIDRVRSERSTGLLELEIREQKRALVFVDGQLHLPGSHPHAARWRELLALPRAAVPKSTTPLLEQLTDQMRDWGAVAHAQFHAGRARFPSELVGPLPTGRLLRVAAARDPRVAEQVRARFAKGRIVAESGAASGSFVGTPEELWILERLRQPTTLAEIERESPMPIAALHGALAGLAATGQLRSESEAAKADRADELTDLAKQLEERIGRQIEREPVDADRDGFRQRIGALLSQCGGLDHFELLGVDLDSEPGETQLAFEELGRLVHPSNAERYAAPDLAEPLHFLFERAVEAYRTLSDPALRVAYAGALGMERAPAVEIDPEARAREVRELARRQYSRARSEESNGDYHTALTLYEEVVRLDPSVEHWSALARLQEKNPAWTARAIDSWRSALALDAQNGSIRYALGELYEKSGDNAQALQLYQAAASGATPLAAAAAAAERLRSGREQEAARGSGPRLLRSLFRRG